jgi:hypothetical protein
MQDIPGAADARHYSRQAIFWPSIDCDAHLTTSATAAHVKQLPRM